MKSCGSPMGGARRRAVIAGLALSALAAPALAQQQDQPFKTVSFGAVVPEAAGSPAAAQAPAAPAAPADPGYVTFFKSTELGGLVDAYYMFNSTKVNPSFRAFDVTHNSFTLSSAEVWLAKSPDKDSPVGFKVRLNFGPMAKLINFNEPGNGLENVEEGFVSYLAPVGKGLQLDFGKFVTNAGAEVIEAKDNWNYSRSLLFQNAIPLYHAGVRATYTVNDNVTLMGGIVNGWNNVNDNNTGKTVMASVTYKPAIPMLPLSIVENYIGGPEKTGTNEGWRNLSDTVISYTATPMVSVMGNVDYGAEKPIGGGESAKWFGVAGYVKVQATPKVAISPRFEYFDDKNGNQTTFVQKLKSATVTLELKPQDNFMWRIEYRGDFSDQEVFTNSDGVAKKNQSSLILGLLYSFSTK